jgi:hypothetical protein
MVEAPARPRAMSDAIDLSMGEFACEKVDH